VGRVTARHQAQGLTGQDGSKVGDRELEEHRMRLGGILELDFCMLSAKLEVK
jgi:hypothetical protein